MQQRRLAARPGRFRLSALALAIAAAPVGAVEENVVALEHIEVVGQAASMDEALKDQRRSDSVQSTVHADGVAQLPDENVAEAAQRLPGVSIERDQNEGRFVSVRGLGPDLNSVTINGTLVPAPESGRRAVALDVLPAELVQSLSVVKTLTPDMDANSLGGTIEVESLSAFDHDGLFYTLSSEASHDENTGENSPKFSGAISQRFSLGDGIDNFGVAAAYSWSDRDFGSDNVETGGDWDFEDGPRLEGAELRDYEISRERTGFGLNFDYRPDDYSSYYLRTLYSRYADSETRNAAGVEFADPLAPGGSGEAEGWRELKDRTEIQTIRSYVLGGERLLGPWTLKGQVGYSRSSENSRGLGSAVFESDEEFEDAGFTSRAKPHLNIGSGFFSADGFSFDEAEMARERTTDTERNLKLDLARDYELSGHAAQVKFGGKLSRRDKDNDTDIWTYEDLDEYGLSDAQLAMSGNTSGTVHYGLGNFGPGLSASRIRALLGGLDRDDFYDEEESRVNDYDMKEDIDAAYLMHSLDIGDLRIIAGMRYERTRFEARGSGIRDGDFESIDERNTYDHWLPGLHLRYRLGENTQVRAAITNSVVRPTFGQLAPGFVIDGDEASFGNPNLSPLESRNFDLGIEHYLGRAGVVSAFLFYKDIDNFAYNTDLAGSGVWADFSEANTYANGDRADLWGLELAWSQKFDWLPAPWNGLLVGGNLTFTHSEASISSRDPDSGRKRHRDIDLPNQSKRVGNLMLGWEDDRLSLRLSLNYKSDYLQEVAGIDDEDHDLYVDDQTFVDFSARYSLTPNLQLSFEAQNLTDEHYYVYSGHRSFNAQYEEYGPTYKVGLTLVNF
ncbi:TonB-dependent receptor [Azotobacter vinelandii]|uniref:TonB-dependent receptor n=1 Tax=Azotobacter vinelandii TaxID=354 RepID=UPI002666ECB6|nr:TonB-dependent receptor [Azotobacter vinelandii]WKN22513.1 TonB-dependent receptor [Azotobacter vinelandii]